MKFLVDQARAVLAGPRRSSVLSSGDINFAKGRLAVRRSLQRVTKKMVLIEVKPTELRTIELPAVTIAALREQRIRQQSAREWAGAGWKDSDWDLVFTTGNGTPRDERGVLRRFEDHSQERWHAEDAHRCPSPWRSADPARSGRQCAIGQ
jgi:hypothetical protein